MKQQRGTEAEVVAITGASAGLGRSIAQVFAKHGARIGLIARGKERLASAAREITELGGKAIGIPADVAHHEQVEAAAEKIEAELGPIDVWINNAMTTVFGELTDITSEEFRRATEVTYLGAVWGTKAALKRMIPRDTGTIVQIGSALAYRSIPLQAPYCGAKHAIAGFTDSLRAELIHKRSRVRLSMVQMPALNTPQFEWCRTRMPRQPQPVPPIYNPEGPARAVYWAAHHHPREIYVGFSTCAAIYGNELAPGVLDYYLGRTGYGSQQSSDRVSAARADNLFTPVEGEFASHGRFDNMAVGRSGFSPKARKFALLSAIAVLIGATIATGPWQK
jgi:short-subunit dehydrogenase